MLALNYSSEAGLVEIRHKTVVDTERAHLKILLTKYKTELMLAQLVNETKEEYKLVNTTYNQTVG